MAVAPAPGLIPLQFAAAPDYSKAMGGFNTLAKGVGQAMNAPPQAMAPGSTIPGAQGPTSVGGPAGPMPVQPPTLMDALKNMSPQQVLAALQRSSTPPAPTGAPAGPAAPQGGLPGAALFQQAGAGMADPSTYGG